MLQGICEQCSGKFASYKPQRFCSKACRLIGLRPSLRICVTCNKPFRPRGRGSQPGPDGQRHCSRECVRRIWRRPKGKRVDLACAQCGKSFNVTATRARIGAKFCSASCMKAARPLRPHTCQWCGASFNSIHGAPQFCSRRCQGLSRRRNLRVCIVCQKEFRPLTTHVQHCSRKCAIITAHARCGFKQRPQTWRPCVFCKKQFFAVGQILYCSRSCQSRRYWQMRGYTSLRICQQCGVQFRTDRGKQTFCSQVCSHRAYTLHLPQECSGCGVLFKRGYRVKYPVEYCSQKCWVNRLDRSHDRAICVQCGHFFTRWSSSGRFCSRKCAKGFTFPQQCRGCGTTVVGHAGTRWCERCAAVLQAYPSMRHVAEEGIIKLAADLRALLDA